MSLIAFKDGFLINSTSIDGLAFYERIPVFIKDKKNFLKAKLKHPGKTRKDKERIRKMDKPVRGTHHG